MSKCEKIEKVLGPSTWESALYYPLELGAKQETISTNLFHKEQNPNWNNARL